MADPAAAAGPGAGARRGVPVEAGHWHPPWGVPPGQPWPERAGPEQPRGSGALAGAVQAGSPDAARHDPAAPDIVAVSFGRIPMGPNALRHSEAVLAVPRADGVPGWPARRSTRPLADHRPATREVTAGGGT